MSKKILPKATKSSMVKLVRAKGYDVPKSISLCYHKHVLIVLFEYRSRVAALTVMRDFFISPHKERRYEDEHCTQRMAILDGIMLVQIVLDSEVG